ncbi:nuclear transport factor 2 family protein [Dokdonia sp. Hel_I_53]|uniref:nuclear transport factor 2 family protein n=1 Tax=Dokdonia sp. Hel_I_53 TaxID=1566287 RepID=UPI00119ABB4B|nr:nuclear transport factor 2 family protein [Dokdonia sp. Hel_I_53]TVZ51068.1 hypothetical protein OD90_0204 [Dokdonia sp. Hel_I_53]
MAKSNKKIVAEFYNSDFFNEPENIDKFLHPEMKLFWNAKTGYSHMDIEDIRNMAAEAGKSFDSVRPEVTHLFSKENQVTIRFTYFVTTIEQPEIELPIAHFMAIWELTDGLLHRGYQMSQPIEESKEAMKSWK